MSLPDNPDDNDERQKPLALFVSAKEMIPAAELEEHKAKYNCGNLKRKGCLIKVADPRLYFCHVCMAEHAVGADFNTEYRKITQEEVFAIPKHRLDNLHRLEEYWQKWTDNYPRGATLW